MTEGVAGAVDARTLAVPDGEHAVEVALVAEDVRLLRAPACRRREVLVDARLEVHVVLLQEFRRGRELLVVAAERGTAIAGDVRTGLLADGSVAALLHQGQAHERLGAGEKDASLVDEVLVGKGDVEQSHGQKPRLV